MPTNQSKDFPPSYPLHLPLTHQANCSFALSHCRARYQATRGHPHSPKPTEIIQMSQFLTWFCPALQPLSKKRNYEPFLRRATKGFPLAPLLPPDWTWYFLLWSGVLCPTSFVSFNGINCSKSSLTHLYKLRPRYNSDTKLVRRRGNWLSGSSLCSYYMCYPDINKTFP